MNYHLFIQLGLDANLKKSCTWKTSDKNYASTFVMDKDKLSCTVDFSKVTVTDSAVIDVTGFDIGSGKHAATQAKLHVGSMYFRSSVPSFGKILG